MIEYFDVVDLMDVETGEKTTKAEAHVGHIIHRCVAVYVFDKHGNLYVQHHKKSGMFDHTVGGHVSAGEDYITAALRESEEEIGLRNQLIIPIATGVISDEVFNPKKQTSRQFHMFGIFESHPDDGWVFIANDEVDELTLMTLESVAKDMQVNPTRYTPGFINTMSVFIELKGLDIEFDSKSCRTNWGEL